MGDRMSLSTGSNGRRALPRLEIARFLTEGPAAETEPLLFLERICLPLPRPTLEPDALGDGGYVLFEGWDDSYGWNGCRGVLRGPNWRRRTSHARRAYDVTTCVSCGAIVAGGMRLRRKGLSQCLMRTWCVPRSLGCFLMYLSEGCGVEVMRCLCMMILAESVLCGQGNEADAGGAFTALRVMRRVPKSVTDGVGEVYRPDYLSVKAECLLYVTATPWGSSADISGDEIVSLIYRRWWNIQFINVFTAAKVLPIADDAFPKGLAGIALRRVVAYRAKPAARQNYILGLAASRLSDAHRAFCDAGNIYKSFTSSDFEMNTESLVKRGARRVDDKIVPRSNSTFDASVYFPSES